MANGKVRQAGMAGQFRALLTAVGVGGLAVCFGDLTGTFSLGSAAARESGAANERVGPPVTGGLQFQTPDREQAVLTCASYADYKARAAGARYALVDRIVRLRKVKVKHFQVQAYIRTAFSSDTLKAFDEKGRPRPRTVFFIDCETVEGQVVHFEYNNFL